MPEVTGQTENAYIIAAALGVRVAVPVSSLAEVIRAPDEDGDSMLYRGRTLALCDVSSGSGGSARRVLVPREPGAAGLRVSGVLGVREIGPAEIKQVSATPLRGAVPRGVTGVAMTGGEVVYVVDPAALSAGAARTGDALR